MLLKQLSKELKSSPKELLLSPTGLLCYMVDCLKEGCTVEDATIKALCYKLSAISIQEVLYNRKLLRKITCNYKRLDSVNQIFNL